MFVKYTLLEDKKTGLWGIEPKVMTPDAACADLYVPYDFVILSHSYETIPLLISFDIPVDWCMYIQPRSSTFTKWGLLSTTGIIDSDYKGSVHMQLYNMTANDKEIKRGMRLVQVQLFQKQRLQFERVQFVGTPFARHPEIGSTGE